MDMFAVFFPENERENITLELINLGFMPHNKGGGHIFVPSNGQNTTTVFNEMKNNGHDVMPVFNKSTYVELATENDNSWGSMPV